MSEKIQPHHLSRQAYVYVRQSTMNQVRNHLESQRRQYDLEERARGLGFQRVVVVDDDLGRSGTGSVERPGFSRLLTAVCSGDVGAVLALEASRLARNNRDWHHLIDLCAMAATLVIDHDGVYDPRLLNDRLLLGLKGTMSEFEISLLRQRALEAHRQKVRRGKVLTLVPVGYVRTEDDDMEITPDRQVQDAVHGIFHKFRELGSIRQVLLWYRNEKLMIPTLGEQSGHRKVVWTMPVYPSLLLMLKNPTYAGAFVYGRRQTRTTVIDGRARKTRGHPRPQQQWEVFIPNHHEGYITWEQYMENQRQIEANAGWSGRLQRATGAPKAGPALLAGLMRCGVCGRPLHVKYSVTSRSRVPRYECRGDRKQCQVQRCLGFGGARVDQVVVAEVLEAIRPVGIQAALDAWDQSQNVEDEKERALKLALDKARYEANRIERQYEATEPENRLVAAELERRWNAALAHVADLEARLADAKSKAVPLGEEQRQQLLRLGEDLEQLWDHPACPTSLKKRVLRTVLKEIIATEVGDPPQIFLKLHWAGGAHTELSLRKNQSGHHNRINSREVIDLVRELAQVCDDSAIVGILNRLGYRTGNENTWNEKRLQHVRHSNGIPACLPPEQRNWVTNGRVKKTIHGQCVTACQKPDATNVAGLRTWNSLGRFVKRGERGILILAPMIVRKTANTAAEATEDAKHLQVRLYGFRAVYVFDIRQTEGKDLPALTEVQGDVSGYRERLVKFVESRGITLDYSEKIAPAKGLSHGGKITLLVGLQPAEEFTTLAHEIGHEMLHRGERRTLTTKQVRETEAEAVAFVVCRAIGLETGSAAADYIQLWHGDTDLLRESLEAVQQTAATILGGIAPEVAEAAAAA